MVVACWKLVRDESLRGVDEKAPASSIKGYLATGSPVNQYPAHGYGNWMITHEHFSRHFYMDGSYKTAVDLKP